MLFPGSTSTAVQFTAMVDAGRIPLIPRSLVDIFYRLLFLHGASHIVPPDVGILFVRYPDRTVSFFDANEDVVTHYRSSLRVRVINMFILPNYDLAW